MAKINLKEPTEVRLLNIVDMSLTFSAMIRLYEKGTKKILHDEIVAVLLELVNSKSPDTFKVMHHEFCLWGMNSLSLAEKWRNKKLIKKSGPPSYGQVAKTLDVVLKVVFYYSLWPNELSSKQLSVWLNAAIDTRMMAFLKSKYPIYLKEWPITVENVDEILYFSLQKLVRRFIADEHNDRIMPVQFDDLYWNYLNR